MSFVLAASPAKLSTAVEEVTTLLTSKMTAPVPTTSTPDNLRFSTAAITFSCTPRWIPMSGKQN